MWGFPTKSSTWIVCLENTSGSHTCTVQVHKQIPTNLYPVCSEHVVAQLNKVKAKTTILRPVRELPACSCIEIFATVGLWPLTIQKHRITQYLNNSQDMCTWGTWRHILGPTLVTLKKYELMMIPELFEYFSEKWSSQKIEVFSLKEWHLPLFWLG